jgi:peptide alpha-N-acetyltransferase
MSAKRAVGLALKNYDRVDRIFGAYVEDQMDFHGYCLRRGTLGAYLDMLTLEDKMRGHASFVKAAVGAARASRAPNRPSAGSASAAGSGA